MGFWSSVKEFASNTWADLVTNKQVSKGILDYDRFQQYNKVMKSADTQQQQFLSQQMVDQGIVDPLLYTNYLKNEAENQVKKMNDPNSNEYRQNLKQEGINQFTNKLKESVKDSYATGDRRQKQVLEKAVQELTKEYERTYGNVMDTYRDYKDEGLMKAWNEVKDEYESLILNASHHFSKSIAAGKSYQDAYKDLIATGKEKANRIVNIQNQLRRKGDWAGIKGSIYQAEGVLGSMKAAWKGMSNIVSGAIGLMGEVVEEGKQALGYYDVLEELSNLGVWKDGEKFKGVKQVQNWAFEVFDGLPNILPEIGTMMAGGYAFRALKVPEMMTAGLRSAGLAKKTAKVSRAGRFLSECLEDFFIYDAVAQASMGRPMTDEDIRVNWLMNIPINGLIARFAPRQWMHTILPLKHLNSDMVSNGILALIKDNNVTAKELMSSLYFDLAFRTAKDEKAAMKILQAVGGSEETFKKAVTTSDKKLSTLLELKDISPEQLSKYKEAVSMLDELQNNIKIGKVDVNDMYMLDLGERLKRTKGANIGAKNLDEVAEKGLSQYKRFVESQVSPEQQKGLFHKQLQRDARNIINQGLITEEEFKNIVKEIPDGTLGRTIFESMYDESAKKELVNKLKTPRESFGTIQAKEELNAAYDFVQNRMMDIIDWNKVQAGTNVGYFVFNGLEEGAPKFSNLFDSTKNYSLDEAREVFKQMGSHISGKDNTARQLLSFTRDKNSSQVGRMAIEFDNKGRGVLFDNTSMFKGLAESTKETLEDGTVAIKDSILKSNREIAGEFNKIGKRFGIKYDVEMDRVITTRAGLEKIASTMDSLDKKAWNLSTITKDEFDIYKVIFAQPYLDAFNAFKQEGKEFTTYFDKLFKQNPDGTLSMNIKYISSRRLGEALGGSIKESADFINSESIITEAFVEDWIKGLSNGQAPEDGIKHLMNQYESEGIKQRLESIAMLVKDQKSSKELTNSLSRIMGDILGQREGNAYIKQMFKDIDDTRLYRNILGGLIAKDYDSVMAYTKRSAEILNEKGFSASKLYQEITKLREILNSRTDIGTFRAKILKIIEDQEKLFSIDKLKSPDSFYRNYAKIKDSVNGKQMKELTEHQLEEYSKNVSIATLDRYGILDKNVFENVNKRVYNIIKSFQEEFPELKLKSSGTFKGIAVDVTDPSLFLDDVVSLHTLINLAKKENFDKYIFHHEKQHILNYKNIEGNIKKLSQRIRDNIKLLEGVEGVKELDSLVFYNKGTLNESMELLDILAGDTKSMVDKLVEISSTNDVPSLHKIMGQIEEAVTEQQALYYTYKNISDPELLAKVKDKLELIEYKLDDNEVLTNRTLWASNPKQMSAADLIKIPESVKTSTSIPTEVIREVISIPEGLRGATHDKIITSWLNGETSKGMQERTKAYDYISQHKLNQPIPLDDVLNVFQTSTSMVSEGFANGIKSILGGPTNIDLKNVLIGEGTLKKWMASSKEMPLDIYISNKFVANVLSALGEYTEDNIKLINNVAADNIINQSTYLIKKEPKKYVEAFLDIIREDGIDFKKFTDKEYQQVADNIVLNIKSALNGDSSPALYKHLNEFIDESKTIVDAESRKISKEIDKLTKSERIKQLDSVSDLFDEDSLAKQIVEDIDSSDMLQSGIGFSEELDGLVISEYINKFMDDLTDNCKLIYDPNLIGVEEAAKSLPYNSLVSVLDISKDAKEYKNILSKSPGSANRLLNIKEGKYYENAMKNVEKVGVYDSIKKGIVDTIEIRFGESMGLSKAAPSLTSKGLNEYTSKSGEEHLKRIITINKNTINKMSPYDILHHFIEPLTKGEHKRFETIIDGNSFGVSGLHRFWETIPGKLILEKIGDPELAMFKGLYYSKGIQFDSMKSNKEILERIYKSLSLKDWFRKDQRIYREFNEYLLKNKGLPADVIEKDIAIKLAAIRKIDPNRMITPETLKSIRKDVYSKIDKKRMFTKNETEIYNKLHNYLYSKDMDGALYKQKRMENVLDSEIVLFSDDSFKAAEGRVVAIRPKLDILEEEAIVGSTYASDWVSTAHPERLMEAKPYSGIEGITDFNTKVNYSDGEFLVKIESANGKLIDGVAIKEGGELKIIPVKDISQEYKSVMPKEMEAIRKADAKHFQENIRLIEDFLKC